MDQFLTFLQVNFPLLFSHKYIFLFFGAAIEGLNTMVLGGFLVSTKAIPLLPTFAVFTLGYTLNGYLWYAVGYFGGAKPIDKWGRTKPKSDKIIKTVQEYFERHSGMAIIITKFTFSLTIAALIMAGSLKYNLRRFTVYNFIGSIGWVSLTLFIGYFFGQSYRFFFVYIKNFTYLLIFLAGAIILVYILKFIFESAFIKAVINHRKVRYYSEKIRNGLDIFLPNDGGKK
ncbi:MAG: DedA family protein [Candidatus Yanofskybacteria bacterium]|nr:DedA family protein [Candidatus Yanofskybacteria bacterium]